MHALALAAALLSSPAPQSGPTKNLEIFDAAWRTVNEQFFDPGFLGTDWKAAREKHRGQAEGAKDDDALQAVIYRMLRELKASHLEIRRPVQATDRAFVAVLTRWVGKDLVVTRVMPGSDAQRAGLRTGDVVANPEQLGGTPGSMAALEVRSNGRRRTVQVKRERAFWSAENPTLRWRTIEQGAGRRIGLITILRFDDRVTQLIDAAMADLANTKAIIFDVRGNSGGNSSSIKVLSYIAPPDIKVNLAMLGRPALKRLGRMPTAEDLAALPSVQKAYSVPQVLAAMIRGGAMVFATEDMGERRYRGRVYGLVNEGTGSSAEGFGHGLRLAGATLIGRRTPGALLSGSQFPLPHGWSMTVPVFGLWLTDGTSLNDAPVTPHHEVRWSVEDYRNGRDPDLTKALEIIGREAR